MKSFGEDECDIGSVGSSAPLLSISLTLAAGLPTMSFMPTFGGFQKGGAAKFGIASQMAARTPEPMPTYLLYLPSRSRGGLLTA